MIKNVIIQHKHEKEAIPYAGLIRRDRMEYAEKTIQGNLIKIVTGPRRAGKSTLCMMLLEKISCGYVNFDDDLLLQVKNSDEILTAIAEVYGNPEILFFDEIQNLKNWELFINKLHRRGKNIIITGSNSKLLSKELSSHLTGRHIPLTIYPFSFLEFLTSENFATEKDTLVLPEIKGRLFQLLNYFMTTGGYPEIILKKFEPKVYLSSLFDSILMKDVAKRYHVKFIQKIYDLALFLISNTANEFSFSKIKTTLKFNSVATIQNYIRYLEETYLIFLLNRYSTKIREQINSPKKIYTIDNGMIAAKAFQVTENYGRLMENFVFTELLKRNFMPNETLFYFKTRYQREIDFILREGIKIKSLIQVVYDISHPDTLEREIRALAEASDELYCNEMLVITWAVDEEINYKTKKIRIIPLWKWLLN